MRFRHSRGGDDPGPNRREMFLPYLEAETPPTRRSGSRKDDQNRAKCRNSRTKPASQHLRRIPVPSQIEAVNNELDRMLEQDIIEEVTEASPWVSNLVIVPKSISRPPQTRTSGSVG